MLPSAQSYTYTLSFTAKIASTSLLPLLSCLVRQCHIWREALPLSGIATLEPWHCRDLNDRWGKGVFISFPFFSNVSLLPLNHSVQSKAEKCSSLSSIGDLELPSFSIDFPINAWEKKIPNSIREQIHWFPTSKEHLVHVLVGGCICYSWSLAPSRLECRPWSLPTCVVAPGG